MLRLINFAHSEVFMYGTFAALWVVMLLGGTVRRGRRRRWSSGCWPCWSRRWSCPALIAVLLERVAYRPLLKRNAPPLIVLISAIGASFVLAELMGLRDKLAQFVGLEAKLDNYVGRARDNACAARDHHAQAGVQHRQLRASPTSTSS